MKSVCIHQRIILFFLSGSLLLSCSLWSTITSEWKSRQSSLADTRSGTFTFSWISGHKSGPSAKKSSSTSRPTSWSPSSTPPSSTPPWPRSPWRRRRRRQPCPHCTCCWSCWSCWIRSRRPCQRNFGMKDTILWWQSWILLQISNIECITHTSGTNEIHFPLNDPCFAEYLGQVWLSWFEIVQSVVWKVLKSNRAAAGLKLIEM